jgi:hypothetical protein
MPEQYPLPEDVFTQLRAEHVPLSEIVKFLIRCRELGVSIVAQVIGGEIRGLWAHPGTPTDFVECNRRAARPVADGLDRLLKALAAAR